MVSSFKYSLNMVLCGVLVRVFRVSMFRLINGIMFMDMVVSIWFWWVGWVELVVKFIMVGYSGLNLMLCSVVVSSSI